MFFFVFSPEINLNNNIIIFFIPLVNQTSVIEYVILRKCQIHEILIEGSFFVAYIDSLQQLTF